MLIIRGIHLIREHFWANLALGRFKKIDVSFSCFCPGIDEEFRHNIVKAAVYPRSDIQAGFNRFTSFKNANQIS